MPSQFFPSDDSSYYEGYVKVVGKNPVAISMNDRSAKGVYNHNGKKFRVNNFTAEVFHLAN